MFKNILVPTDLSQKSIKAFEIALDMAREEDSKVTLLHVIETLEEDGGEEFQDFYDKLTSRAQDKMEEIVKQNKPVNVPVYREIIYGKRVKEIVHFAFKNEIDLIILSSHKIDDVAVGYDGWATISYRVGILSPCPVMMVKS